MDSYEIVVDGHEEGKLETGIDDEDWKLEKTWFSGVVRGLTTEGEVGSIWSRYWRKNFLIKYNILRNECSARIKIIQLQPFSIIWVTKKYT